MREPCETLRFETFGGYRIRELDAPPLRSRFHLSEEEAFYV